MTSKDNISSRKVPEFNGLQTQLHHSAERVFPYAPESTELSVACYRGDFSASRIARAVEDADAHLLNLNITSEVLQTGEIVVDLRISHRSHSAVARSLERYGYNVIQVRDHSAADNDPTLSERVSQLLTYINV
ncbi:MAG: hypothetical protein J1E38_00925 [Paramuribaculum sp.]|nr:hypothetical protein [Paramuribaculum sp.]